MTYLILQILFCLIIAFSFGFLLGWLFGRISANKNQITQPYTPPTNSVESVTRSYVPPPPIRSKEGKAEEPKTEAPPAEVKKAEKPKSTEKAATANPSEVNLSVKGYEIETLEGVGPKTGEALRKNGIKTISDFLEQAVTSSQRSEIASKIAVRPKMVDSWASMSDLLRIKGIDHQAAELIHKSGINTVTELSQQNVDTFSAKMETVNNAGKRTIAPEVPSRGLLTDWVSQASNMKSAIKI